MGPVHNVSIPFEHYACCVFAEHVVNAGGPSNANDFYQAVQES